MDVKTQALDRVLEALSPTLEAELDRVVQETRAGLEQEFQTRLQTAVRDAETATASAARTELDRAVNQAREDTRREVTAELGKQFDEKLDAAASQLGSDAAQERAKLEADLAQLKQDADEERARLQADMAQRKDEWSGELSKVEDERARWQTFAETQRQFADASSQAEILTRFLSSAQPFAQGLAVYITKADGLALWKSKGDGAFPQILSKETTDPESYFKAICVRGKTVGAICASPSFQVDALDFLAGSLERAIEAYGLKLRMTGTKQAV